jgi:hypothetical protein
MAWRENDGVNKGDEGIAVPLNRHCEPRQRRGNLLHLAHSVKYCIQAVVVERDLGDYNTSV